MAFEGSNVVDIDTASKRVDHDINPSEVRRGNVFLFGTKRREKDRLSHEYT